MTMEEKTENICRLCLKVEAVAFSPLDAYCYERIKVVIPELIVNGTDFVICNRCKSSLEKSHVLFQTFDENDKIIRNKKNELKITDSVNLAEILNNSDAPEGKSTCRICLNSNEGNYTSINEATTDASFNNVLKACLPELDRNLTADPIICESCHKTITDMHALKTDVLAAEEKIKQYCESDPEAKNLTVAQVLPLLRDTEKYDVDNDFLSEFEVRDEEGADIFDSISDLPANQEGTVGNAQWKSDYEPSKKKRPAEASSNAGPPKKAKVNLESKGDDLPYFKINFQLLYDIKGGVSLKEWLSLVEAQKKKNSWSDNVTIQKVLLRLKEIPDLYTWFSSIAEILTWEEWKKKLVQAFPNDNDYHIRLKRLLNRKKKQAETFVEYYKAKMELIESLDLSGENAVSCLLGGLVVPNILVSCIARIGNYKTPEEVLVYFKSCDEKQNVKEKNKPPVEQSPSKPAEKSPLKPFVRSTPRIVDRSTKPTENRNKVVGKVVTPNQKTSKIVQGQSSKKRKGKCFKCFQRGHTAADCRKGYPAVPLKPVSGPKPHPASVRAAPGNVRISPQPSPKRKCIRCGLVGHRPRACPKTKIERLLQMQAANQNSQAVYSSPVHCSVCKKANHTAYNCPQLKNKSPQSQNQHKDHRNSPEKKCVYCGKLGHTVYDCREVRKKALQAKENPPRRYKDPSGGELEHVEPDYARGDRDHDRETNRQDKGSYKPSSNCYYCGSHGHDSTTCRQASRAGEESYFKDGTYNEGQAYRQLLCFKCYKIGHEAEDCSRYPQRSYRE